MIKSKLAVLMAQHSKGPLKMVQVAEGAGVRQATISAIYHSQMKRVEMDTLEALCTFFDCQPGDLFVRE